MKSDICTSCCSVATFQRCDLCSFSQKKEKTMKTAYKTESALLKKFQLIDKMKRELERAEQGNAPEKYIRRLADTIVAYQQRLGV